MKDKLREDRHDAIAKAIADTIGHGMREKCERHADAVLVILDAEGDGGAEWRCFHCDVVFNNYQDAAIHFGVYRMQEMHTPACQIDIAEYRRMEAENKDYREEDATIHRQMRGMEIDHARALRRAEEDGYAKGLSAHPARSGVVSEEMVAAYVAAVNEHLGNMTENEWQADRLDKHAHLARVARIGLTAALESYERNRK